MKNNKYIDYKLIQAITGNVYEPSVEYVDLLKENNSLKEELHLWVQTYYKIIGLFRKVIPINNEKVNNGIDKPNTLLLLCRDITKSIEIPENLFQKYQNQLQKEYIAKNNPNSKNINNNPEIFLKNKPYVEQLQSSQITNRLNDIDKILSDEIAKNKKYIPKSNSNQKKKRSLSADKKDKMQFSPSLDIFASPFNEKINKNEAINDAQTGKQNTRSKSPPASHGQTRKRKNRNKNIKR